MSIEISNVGRIERVKVPYTGRGVVLLRGPCGSGKSTILSAIEKAATGRGELPLRDGAKSGFVDGFGIHLHIGRSSRRTGELEVAAIEGKYDLASFVDPGIDDPERADAARIRALAGLLDLKGDPDLFAPLVGGMEQLKAVASEAAIEATDLVAQAAAMKRDFERASRAKAEQAKVADAEAFACKQQIKAVPEVDELDPLKLQQAHEQAIAEHSRIRAVRDRVRTQADAIERAKVDIRRAKEAREKLPTKAEIAANIEASAAGFASAVSHRAACEAELERAKAALSEAVNCVTTAQAAKAKAEQQATHAADLDLAIERWSSMLTTTIEDSPSEQAEAEAAAAVAAASKAIGDAAIVRHARSKLAEAEAKEHEAKEAGRLAVAYREAAHATDGVLSDAINHPVLRVVGGRLVLDTVRGETAYHELSPGEKWPIGIQIGVKRVGKGGIIVLPQTAWDGLDEKLKADIARLAYEYEVQIYAAEAGVTESGEIEIKELAT